MEMGYFLIFLWHFCKILIFFYVSLFSHIYKVHGDQYPEVQLAQVKVKKGGKVVPKKLPSDNFPKLYDYRNAKINKGMKG